MNSPTLVNTPVKRLGTGRRKSSSALKNILKASISSSSSPRANTISTPSESVLTPFKLLKSLKDIENCSPNILNEPDPRNADEIQLEKRLSNLQDVAQLEESVKIWRVGCKEALLELQEWFKLKEDVKISCKTLSKKLGIWSVISEHYHSDSEVFSSGEEDD